MPHGGAPSEWQVTDSVGYHHQPSAAFAPGSPSVLLLVPAIVPPNYATSVSNSYPNATGYDDLGRQIACHPFIQAYYTP